jgi:hypothetical protein
MIVLALKNILSVSVQGDPVAMGQLPKFVSVAAAEFRARYK